MLTRLIKQIYDHRDGAHANRVLRAVQADEPMLRVATMRIAVSVANMTAGPITNWLSDVSAPGAWGPVVQAAVQQLVRAPRDNAATFGRPHRLADLMTYQAHTGSLLDFVASLSHHLLGHACTTKF